LQKDGEEELYVCFESFSPIRKSVRHPELNIQILMWWQHTNPSEVADKWSRYAWLRQHDTQDCERFGRRRRFLFHQFCLVLYGIISRWLHI